MKYICDVTTRDELAIFLDIPLRKLTHILYCEKPNNLYHSFEIKKKNGGTRHIDAPDDELIGLQYRIAKALEDYEEKLRSDKNIKSLISHAFEKNKSIMTNAQIHINKRVIINLDLKDFFPSIHFGRILGFFTKNKDYNLSYEVAVILAQLCCIDGHLPQGAPTSPILSNMLCRILDIRILKIAKKYKVDYTRYADDLTFSTNNKAFLEIQNEFLNEIKDEIKRAGFDVNDKKTRIQYRNSKQEVTGLIVNKKINVDRRYYRETRAMANSLYTNNEFFIDGKRGTINQLEGRFSFINQIDKFNNKLDKSTPFSVKLQNGNEENFRRFSISQHDFRTLCGREEEYRKFLFYKYFYSNKKPLILTEGKTDIRYIKAALKKVALEDKNGEYFELVNYIDNKFEFKISFFNRSKKFFYLFNIGVDGGDEWQKLYNYYSGRDNYKNYYNYFYEKSKTKPSNPVIVIYDNEIEEKDTPLYKFVNYISSTTEEKDKLKRGEFINLKNFSQPCKKNKNKERKYTVVENSNIYILAPQRIEDKKTEMEDLFDKKTQDTVINGRKFSRKDVDKEKYYNKDIFSNYIMANYKTIDFSNFMPLLNNINIILKEYSKQNNQ